MLRLSTLEPGVLLARFSNRGPELYTRTSGVAVLSTVLGGGYAFMDGTSMACPQVTGWLPCSRAALICCKQKETSSVMEKSWPPFKKPVCAWV